MKKQTIPQKGDMIQVLISSYDPNLPHKIVNGKTKYQDVMGDYTWKYFNNNHMYRQMTVTGYIYWADNSTDIEGVLDDGTYHKTQWVSPHGDVC